MAKALPGHRSEGETTHVRPRDWRKGMSDNVAYALLVYTGLQIFVTMHAIQDVARGSTLPYLSLIVLVAAIIPACRRFEKRWENIDPALADDPALRPIYRRDQAFLWLLGIGLPFALTALFTVIETLL